MVNDSHLHIGSSPQIDNSFNKENFKQFKHDNNIEHCLLFPLHFDGMVDTHKKILHNWTKELLNEDKTIHGLQWLKGGSHNHDIYDTLHQELDDGFIGWKYHGSYEKLPISDHIFDNILLELNRKKGILLVHCGMYLDGDIKSNTSYLHALLVAGRYPNIKVILGHMGGSINPVIKNAINHAKGLHNVWFETSGVTNPNIISYTANVIGIRRVLFGSDAPWLSFKAQYHNVMDCNLPDGKKKLILEENFLELLQ